MSTEYTKQNHTFDNECVDVGSVRQREVLIDEHQITTYVAIIHSR